VKAASHAWQGAASSAASMTPLPVGVCGEIESYSEQFRLVDENENPLAFRPYRLVGSNGQVWTGTSDSDGLTEEVFTNEPVEITVEVLPAEAPVEIQE
jgi:type VI secretion system secreted protein VgrG